MKKTLLSALKHGSGTIFILLSMMLGVSLQAWGAAWDSQYEYYVKFDNDIPVSQVEILRISGDNNHRKVSFDIPGGSSSLGFTIYCSNGSYYRNTSFSCSTANCETSSLDATTGESMSLIPIATGGYVCITVEMWCEYGGNSKLSVSQVVVRCFSAGEKFYLLNTSTYRVGNDDNKMWFQSGTNGKAWIHLWGGSSGESDAEFTYLSGGEETTSGIYQATIAEGCYANFLITRNGSSSTGPWSDEWNRSAEYVLPASNNRITGTTTSGFSSDFYSPCNNPTVVAGDYSSLTSSSVTIAATVTAALSDPCVISYVGVDVYTDQACTVSASVNKEVSYSGSNYSITGVDVSSLTPKTTYYYKTYAKRSSDNAKVYSSNVGSFTMPCLSGVATTNPSTAGEGPKCLGESFTALSVTASSGPGSGYTYQWYYNTTASTTGAVAIPGAISASYTPNVVGANYYYCGVAAAGGYCEVNSGFSGLTTIKAKPTLSVSQTSVTNYVPVPVTAKGAEVATWSVNKPSGNSYLYKKNSTSAVFKASVGSGSNGTYTITGTTSESCSGTATVTVTSDSQDCH